MFPPCFLLHISAVRQICTASWRHSTIAAVILQSFAQKVNRNMVPVLYIFNIFRTYFYSLLYAKNRHPNGYLLFWYTGRDSLPICHRPIVRMHRRPAGDAQQSTGLLDFIVRVPPIMQKSRHPNGYLLFWYTGRDSNPQPSEPESDALSIEPPVRFLQLSYYSSLLSLCKEESGKYFLSDFLVSTGKRLFSRNSCGIIQNIVNFSLI